MNEVSRRTLLRGLGLASLGVVATTRGSRTAMAVSDWQDTSLTYESSDGTIPSFELGANDINLQFSWSNFPDSESTINVDLQARIIGRDDAAGSYSSVFSGSFTVSQPSGDGKPITGDNIIDSSSFPVSILTNTPIEASNFTVPSDQSSKTTTVEFRVGFDYEGEVVTRDTTCEVTVNRTVSDAVIDNFEPALYEEAGKTLSSYYSGDFSIYTRQTDTVYEQNQALRLDPPGDRNQYDIISYPGDGLKYPQQGDTFSYRHQSNATAGAWSHDIIFGAQDASKFYIVRHDRAQPHFELIETGVGTLQKVSCSYSTSDWMETEVQWGTDGTITCTLYNPDGTQEAQVSVTDSTYDSGGFGWRGGGGADITSYIDDFRFK